MNQPLGCDKGWTEIRGTCVKFHKDKAYGQGRCNDVCKSEGGQLYEPNATEQDKVYKWVQQFYGSPYYFIGATCKYSYKAVVHFWGSKDKK